MENTTHSQFNLSSEAQVVEKGKTISIISYLTLIGLVIALVMNKDKKNNFAQFHIRQSLGIVIVGIVSGLFRFIPVVGSSISMFAGFLVFILWIVGVLSAFNGQKKPIMLIGASFQKWFQQI
ncbi:DUF4870 domain-containing protein [Sphingobacterium sp. SYP-B4668]|uniref:DUF4870 domain-containing protein n=1 Tax=Sphingobacterium sp. SYP-B4668 TaxID=2996035 RepID=UPI0022DD74EE|nr:hypothetical protein [Sphingobacterium sp. SYP-B4668]